MDWRVFPLAMLVLFRVLPIGCEFVLILKFNTSGEGETEDDGERLALGDDEGDSDSDGERDVDGESDALDDSDGDRDKLVETDGPLGV